MSDFIGRSMGRYHILEQLGEGGMATVFKAYDTRLERDAAVKIIRRDVFPPNQLENILKRFEREAKALARLTHSNIVSVIDYGEEDGTPYLVMEYLPGGTLKQRLGKPIPWQESIRLLLPIARALQFAHSQKIAHRDVKPSNILITLAGDPMLTDFGIAKILEGAEGQTLTGTGVGVGTPEYMAPEQWTGQSGPLSDQYSLGVVLYEMVTGRKPYVADTPAAVLLKQANDPLPRPGQFVSGLPDAVEKLLLKVLAKNPEDRYPDMSSMVVAFENMLAGSGEDSQPLEKPIRAPAPMPVEGTLIAAVQQTMGPGTSSPKPAGGEPEDKLTSSGVKARPAALPERQAPPPRKQRGSLWVIGGGVTLLLLAVIAILVLPSIKPAAPSNTPVQPTQPQAPLASTAIPTEAPPVPAPDVTITIWHNWNDEYMAAIARSFREYSAEHPNVRINLEKPVDINARLKIAIPAGSGPDIVVMQNDWIGELALNRSIVALDDHGVTKAFLLSHFKSSAISGVTWDGKIWALPDSQEAITLIYNKALASSADFPSDPMNFNDLLVSAKTFYQARGIPLFCNSGFSSGDAYHTAPVFFGFGVPSYVDDQGNVYVNTPQAVAAGEWLVSIKPYLPAEMDYVACMNAFLEGRVAAWWTGPWAIRSIEDAHIDYGFVTMGRPFIGFKTLALTRNSVDRGHAEVALDIMEFFTSFQIQKNNTLANRTIPTNIQALNDPAIQALPTITGFGANANLGVPLVTTTYVMAQWAPMSEAITAIWNRSQTPASALSAAQIAIKEAIAGMK